MEKEKKVKVNMAASKDPHSTRSKKRANRPFTASRPERRNAKRQAIAQGAREAGVRADTKGGGKGFRAPGAQHFH
jgi:hypothetical protein